MEKEETSEILAYERVEEERERLRNLSYVVILLLTLTLAAILNILGYFGYLTLKYIHIYFTAFFAAYIIGFLAYLNVRERRARGKAEQIFKSLAQPEETARKAS